MVYASLEVVDADTLNNIHDASLSILKRTGMVVDHDEVLNRLEAAGCKVDIEQKRVYFDPDLVTNMLSLVPNQILLGGRDENHDIVIGKNGSRLVTRPLVGAENILDHRTGEVRRSTLNDLREWITVIDALDNIDFNGVLCPAEIHAPSRDIASAAFAFRYTRKHLHTFTYSGEGVNFLAQIAEVIAGSHDEAIKRPPLSFFSVCISPLYLATQGVERILAGGRNGIPTFLNSSPIMGATSPISIAGCVALLNAEVLGMIAISQVFNPGTSVVYTARPFAMNMKSTASTFGFMESTLANALISQLVVQKYGLPIDIIAPCTDSKTVDIQSIMERTWTSILPILSGADIAIGLGNIETVNTNSIPQLILDDELFAEIKRMIKGIKVDSESLALDVIDQVGPKGHFLQTEHTLKHFRGVMRQSHLFDRNFRDTWEKRGRPNVERRVDEKISEILKTHTIDPLTKQQEKGLNEIIKKAEATLTTVSS